MGDDFVPSVKGISKALDTGIKLARRISKFSNSSPGAQALSITETTQALQKSLEEDSQAIRDVYSQAVRSCGEQFTTALAEDQSFQTRLKELRIELLDHLNECQDFEEDEPETFNKLHFTSLQKTSQKCAAECTSTFNSITEPIVQENLRKARLEQRARDDRIQLSSMKERQPDHIRKTSSPTTRRPLPSTFRPELQKPILSVHPPSAEPMIPKSTYSIESPAEFSIGSPVQSKTQQQHMSRDISPSSKPDILNSRFIPEEVVKSRISANEQFLERRKQRKLLFQEEFRKSVSSMKGKRASEVFGNGLEFNSPILGPSIGFSTSAERKRDSESSLGSVATAPMNCPISPVSPVDGYGSRASGSGYENLVTRKRSEASQNSRNSIAGPTLPQPMQRPISQASQELFFGPPSLPHSPPLSDRGSGIETWGPLATTLRTSDFGKGVESGLEVISPIDHENGLMLAAENGSSRPTPTSSMKSNDNPMRHDSSFYKFGGFCEGSKAVLRGEVGFKAYRRPYGQYGETTSARCSKCAYEVGWSAFAKDGTLDKSGIYGSNGIRWRQRFLLKCHVKTNSVEDPIYACIFCIEEHKTVEEHDATVFFSVSSLFRHLAKHSQPLPKIPGIETIYGIQPPTVVDFDLHFTTSIARYPEFCMSEIASKVAARPSGYAKITHHPKNQSSSARDPEGGLVLHFAAGARIVGITFPERFGGQWCMGYHDGERGTFPSSAITIGIPHREDVFMNSQSTLIAYAKWDFKPKDAKEGGWLKLSKGDKITAVGYAFQDQWCWSGQTSKGKWGLFPSAFVEKLQEVKAGQPAGRPESVKSGRGLRIGSVSLGRNKSSRKDKDPVRERSGSLLTQSTTPTTPLSGVLQPGLEVANTRTASWRS